MVEATGVVHSARPVNFRSRISTAPRGSGHVRRTAQPERCWEHASELLLAFGRAERESLTIQKLTRHHPVVG